MMEHKNKLYENVDNRKRSAKACLYGLAAIFGVGDSWPEKVWNIRREREGAL